MSQGIKALITLASNMQSYHNLQRIPIVVLYSRSITWQATSLRAMTMMFSTVMRLEDGSTRKRVKTEPPVKEAYPSPTIFPLPATVTNVEHIIGNYVAPY